MVAVEGYFKNGIIHAREPLSGIPNFRRVIITFLDEEVESEANAEIQKRLDKWAEFDALVAGLDDKPAIEDFPRFSFGRDLIIFNEV